MEILQKTLLAKYDPKGFFPNLLTLFLPLSIGMGVLAGYLIVKFNQPVAILISLFGMVLFFVSIFYVEFGLLILVFITYTRFSDVVIQYHGAPSVAKFFIVLLVLSILMRWALFREQPKGWITLAVLLGIYGLVGFASLIYSPVPSRVWGGVLDYAKDAIIAIVVVVLLQTRSTFHRTLWVMMVAGMFLASLTVIQYFTKTYDNNYGGFAITGMHQIVGENDEYRVGGPLEDPNFFAQILVVLVPISLERFLHEKKNRYKLIALYSTLVTILCLLLTYSRGGFLALVAALGVYFYYYPPKRIQLPIIIIVGLLFFAVAPPRYVDRIFTLTEFFQPKTTLRTSERSFQGRISENLAAWEMIKAQPLFGVGLRSYNYLFPIYSKNLGLALVAGEREAHNLYLEITAETGIVGLLVFMTIVYTSIKALRQARRRFILRRMPEYASMTTGYLAGFAGYMVAALFIHGAYPRYLYLMIGIACSLILVSKDGEGSTLSGPGRIG